MKKLITLSLAGAMALSVSACYTPGERAAGGALLGAGTGAAIGAATTGKAGGALVGGTLGAIGGAALGAATAPPPPPAGGIAPRLKCPRGTCSPTTVTGTRSASEGRSASPLPSPLGLRQGAGCSRRSGASSAAAGLGLALGGPLGALLGGLAGHMLVDSEGAPLGPPPRDLVFTTGLVALAAKMAKADGVVIALRGRRLRPHRRGARRGARPDQGPLRPRQNHRPPASNPMPASSPSVLRDEPKLLEDVLDGLFLIAAADHAVHEAELRLSPGRRWPPSASSPRVRPHRRPPRPPRRRPLPDPRARPRSRRPRAEAPLPGARGREPSRPGDRPRPAGGGDPYRHRATRGHQRRLGARRGRAGLCRRAPARSCSKGADLCGGSDRGRSPSSERGAPASRWIATPPGHNVTKVPRPA